MKVGRWRASMQEPGEDRAWPPPDSPDDVTCKMKMKKAVNIEIKKLYIFFYVRTFAKNCSMLKIIHN